MTDDLTTDLKGWVLALTAPKMLIGRLDDVGMLSPAFEIVVVVSVDERTGQVRADWQAAPVLLLSSFGGLPLPEAVPVKRCEQLDADDRKYLYGAIRKAQTIAGDMRAAKAGIVVAPPGAASRAGS